MMLFILLAAHFDHQNIALPKPGTEPTAYNSTSTASPVKPPAALGSTIPSDWSHWVRLCGNGIDRNRVDAMVQRAVQSGVYGIEVDNDPTGRYDSFLDPTQKLADLKAAVAVAHKAGQPIFAYMAGTECITQNVDTSAHSMLRDHPDWVQEDQTGRKAVFKAGDAFWIAKGDEDVWVSPFAPEWRARYMDIVRQVASTGVDGVYVDVPYWMTHFEGWDKTWASFDKYTVAAFKAKTGLDAMKQVKLDDYRDPGFRKWITFRIQAITDFMSEIESNVKKSNPKCLTIPEIFPGFDEEAPVVGSDVYQLYNTCDLVCHEFNPGGRSSRRTLEDWLAYVSGMETFRGFAQKKPTWMLAYSWDGEKLPSADDAMENLACANVMEGANMWDAGRMVMSGSNDIGERKKIYSWIKQNELQIYGTRTPIAPIGLYFSPASRNFTPDEFVKSYSDTLTDLLQTHTEFQIVTPRTLPSFRGAVLLLPSVTCLSNAELQKLVGLGRSGTALLSARGFGQFSEDGTGVSSQRLETLSKLKTWHPIPRDDSAAPGESADPFSAAIALLDQLPSKRNPVTVQAPPEVLTHTAFCDGRPTIWLCNLSGLGPGKYGEPKLVTGIRIGFPRDASGQVMETPFLGDPVLIKSWVENGRTWCDLPPLEKGAIVQLR